MVFQNYALYPHMDAYTNMAFALKMRGLGRAEIDRRVKRAARVLGLEDVLRKKPRTLSGGQRQRVAMGRAIVREPRAFLMDEPLSNLDAKLRVQMRAEIARIQRDLEVTTIYVTHDQSEAMTLGDRVAVMRKGELQQLDSPQALYRAPVNLFVAEFIGSPAMNLVEAEIADGRARFGDHTLPVDGRTGLAAYEGRKVALGIRPEDLEDAAISGAPPEHRLPVTVDLREDMGAEIFLHFSIDAPHVATEDVKDAVEAEEAVAALEQQAVHKGTPFVARVDRESRAREGDRIEAAVDTRRLHFFDLETGDAIGG
jgi:multiple sugar transport system ATP-binding protein